MFGRCHQPARVLPLQDTTVFVIPASRLPVASCYEQQQVPETRLQPTVPVDSLRSMYIFPVTTTRFGF